MNRKNTVRRSENDIRTVFCHMGVSTCVANMKFRQRGESLALL